MCNQWSISKFGYEMAKRNLPISYMRRVIGELDDHQSDVAADDVVLTDPNPTQSAASRIGDPAQLADQLARSYRSRRFIGHHELYSFFLAPVFLLAVAWTASHTVIALAIIYFVPIDSLSDSAALMIVQTVFGIELFAVPAGVALLLSGLVQRNGLSKGWAYLSTVLIALTAYIPVIVIQPRTGGPGTGRYFLAFFEHSPLYYLNATQLSQLLIPILAVAAFWTWDHCRRKKFVAGLGELDQQLSQEIAA